MSESGGDTFWGKGNAVLLNTYGVLSEENESILSEVLRCNVCLELPAKKQVRVCEEGHHFCMTCHSRMEFCGICRGRLLETRNLAVEQLVSRLGGVLGISNDLPAAGAPADLSPGLYKCLHDCPVKVPVYQMLPHLRKKHGANLLQNVRSNPYSGRFSFAYELPFERDEKCTFSAQVSDMGLFTIETTFADFDFFGWVKMLADDAVSSNFRHQLVIKIGNEKTGSVLEWSATNCPVFSYGTDADAIRREGGGLKVKGAALSEYLKTGTRVGVFFSVWKKEKFQYKESCLPSVFCLPERHLFFENDRKIRRNKSRNMRRKRVKEKYKNLTGAGGKPRTLSGGFSRLTL